MINNLKTLSSRISILLLALAAFPAGQASAQYVLYQWDPAPSGGTDWNFTSGTPGEEANWLFVDVDDIEFRFVPDVGAAIGSEGDSAAISNGLTADITSAATPDIALLFVQNGGVSISGSGSLSVVNSGDPVGQAIIANNGTLSLADNAGFSTEGDFSNGGFLNVTGPSASISVGGDANFEGARTWTSNITNSTNHSTVGVSGSARLAGDVVASFDGFTPTFGQSWDLLTASSISGSFSSVSSATELDQGLALRQDITSTTASVTVGNELILSVDRGTGELTVKNVIGDPISISGYSVSSANGLLDNGSWNPLSVSGAAGTGWSAPLAPSANAIGEISSEAPFAINVGGASDVSLGLGFDFATSSPDLEDLVFQYSTPDGVFTGSVEYGGVPNALALFVDPATGEAALGNVSPNAEALTIVGYTVQSESGQLVAGSWDSLATNPTYSADWIEANPDANGLSELSLGDGITFSLDTVISLGDVFTVDGERDLVFQVVVAPAAGLDGDFNNDGAVDSIDYAVWRENLGTNFDLGGNGNEAGGSAGVVDQDDFNLWLSQFGATGGGAGGPEEIRTLAVSYGPLPSLGSAGSSTAPEPSALLGLAGLMALVGIGRRR